MYSITVLDVVEFIPASNFHTILAVTNGWRWDAWMDVRMSHREMKEY
jgi:hypothetical protein